METQDRAPTARRKPTCPDSPDYALGTHVSKIPGSIAFQEPQLCPLNPKSMVNSMVNIKKSSERSSKIRNGRAERARLLNDVAEN